MVGDKEEDEEDKGGDVKVAATAAPAVVIVSSIIRLRCSAKNIRSASKSKQNRDVCEQSLTIF
jgi:hypothetical protein